MEKQNRDPIAGFAGAAALLLFAWLAHEVTSHTPIRFDVIVRDGLHRLASPGLTLAFRAITSLGSELFLVPFVALMAWRLVRSGRRHAAVLLVLVSAGGEVLDTLAKLVFRRVRPEGFFEAAPHNFSFPSGHSMLSACVFGLAAAILTARISARARRAGIWTAAAALTLAIGTSRIYLGVHYPTDVAAGYAAAVVWVAAVRTGYRMWLRRRERP